MNKTHHLEGISRILAVFCLSLLLSACASQPTTLSDPERDPWEGFNRKVHSFNMGFDRAIFRPVAAQKRHSEISGVDRIHYCGAYWRNGFHEDGVISGMEVGEAFGKAL